ncbi:MAG: hypothetical protein IT245_00845 [Bacteroidia bacterium]|nr:hypothetical protein [Bacteroidia bacterium]
MVRLYDYYGLEVYFKNNILLPITVYARRGANESAVSIHFKNGLVDTIHFLELENELDDNDRETFRLIIEQNMSEIIKLWLDNFLYHKEIPFEIIKNKIN